MIFKPFPTLRFNLILFSPQLCLVRALPARCHCCPCPPWPLPIPPRTLFYLFFFPFFFFRLNSVGEASLSPAPPGIPSSAPSAFQALQSRLVATGGHGLATTAAPALPGAGPGGIWGFGPWELGILCVWSCQKLLGVTVAAV